MGIHRTTLVMILKYLFADLELGDCHDMQESGMKTERIEIVAEPVLKTKLEMEANNLDIAGAFSDEEMELAKLTAVLKAATREAHRDLSHAVDEVTKIVADLRR